MSKKAEGCEKLAIAPLTITGETVTFGTPILIPDLETITITDQYAEGKNYADNQENIYKKKKTGAEISITLSHISKKIEAQLMGKKYNGGEVLSSADDIQIQVAVMYKKTYSDGSFDLIVYYNCKLAKDDNSATTAGENIEFTGVTLSGKASPLPNKQIDYVISSDEVAEDDTELQAKITNFFTEVQTYTTV